MQNQKENFKENFKKRQYTFVLEFINVVGTIHKDTVTEVLIKQSVRSVTSILANYIEGQAASSKRDFLKYFEISLKSANESKFWIALLRDTTSIKRDCANKLLAELNEISNIYGSSVLKLKGKT
ncbi:MAG: four helix bundle protein [Patescibacteria group bacterium]